MTSTRLLTSPLVHWQTGGRRGPCASPTATRAGHVPSSRVASSSAMPQHRHHQGLVLVRLEPSARGLERCQPARQRIAPIRLRDEQVGGDQHLRTIVQLHHHTGMEHPRDAVHIRRVILHHGNDEQREGFCGRHAQDFLVLDVPHRTP
jgi:hypothetical protein